MKRKYSIPVVLTQSLVFSVATLSAIPTFSNAAPPPVNLASEDECLGGSSNYTLSDRTGLVNMVGVQGKKIASVQMSADRASAIDVARGYLAGCGASFGLRDQATELHLKRQTASEKRSSVLKFQQNYQGIPIFASALNIQVDAAGAIQFVNSALVPDISLSTTPVVSADSARLAAARAVTDTFGLSASDGKAINDLETTEPELWVYDPELIGDEGPTVLVWRIEVSQDGPPPIEQMVLVNAKDGSIALSLDNLHGAMRRQTYDLANSKEDYPGTLLCDESNPNCTGQDSDARNAHIYAADAYNFYTTYHGRDSIDNAGMTIFSHVHYSTDYCNAFWSFSKHRMTYGDGCSIVADDIVAHELTHGVTQYESDLVYKNQSGAINESFSDIWGEFIDLTNKKGTDTAAVRWLIGEDISGRPEGNVLRNMKNPPQFKQPDRLGSPYYNTGWGDHGGVHTNSGVGNKTAYLITDGGTFNDLTVAGIGISKTAKIFYKVQTDILTPNATYADLGAALLAACNALVRTSGITLADCKQVQRATIATELLGTRPLTPINITSDTTPSYAWTKLEKATDYSYRLYNSANAVVYSFDSLSSASVCGTSSNCVHTPTTVLAPGNYRWQVRAKFDGTWMLYSLPASFTVTAPGFNSPFTKNAAGWKSIKGTWSVANGYYQSKGVETVASSAHDNNYATLTYQVRMNRTAGNKNYSNSIWIYGDPTTIDKDGRLRSGYLFNYTNSGFYSIYEVKDGNAVALITWRASTSIIKNGWNTLKVSANSSNGFSKWYINDTLVAHGQLPSKLTGRVGVAFAKDKADSHLNVDWANLTLSAPTKLGSKSVGADIGFVQSTKGGVIVDPSVLFRAPPTK